MKNSFKLILLSMLFVVLKFSNAYANCFVDAIQGEIFYTQFSLYYEKNEHKATNYRKGAFLPINTLVTFVKANKCSITVSVYGREISIVNVPKYTGENIQGIFNRTFGRCPVNLDAFSEQEINNILTGNVEIGMSKEAVILALGYPPSHQTPTLYSPQWRYWRNRFGTFIIEFLYDRVSGIKGLNCRESEGKYGIPFQRQIS